MLQGSDRAARQARQLRRDMTMPEILLWQRLRRQPNGMKFRRQHPAGEYVADFYCHDARLTVEVDGLAHGMGDNPQRDQRRDDWLNKFGFRVLRVPAVDVLKDADGTAAAIASFARQHCSPSSRAGEDT